MVKTPVEQEVGKLEAPRHATLTRPLEEELKHDR
jgi:hypothetical protein